MANHCSDPAPDPCGPPTFHSFPLAAHSTLRVAGPTCSLNQPRLRAHVCEAEGLVHSRLRGLVVGGGRHVAAVVAAWMAVKEGHVNEEVQSGC